MPRHVASYTPTKYRRRSSRELEASFPPLELVRGAYICTSIQLRRGEKKVVLLPRYGVQLVYIFTRRIFYYRVNVMSGVKKMKVDEGVIKFLANKKETFDFLFPRD